MHDKKRGQVVSEARRQPSVDIAQKTGGPLIKETLEQFPFGKWPDEVE